MLALSRVFNLVWIGLCALSMLAQTRFLLGLPAAPGWFDGFVLGGAVFAYNFTHRDRLRKTTAWLAGMLGVACFFMPLLSSPDFSGTLSWQAAAAVPFILWLFYYGLRRPGNAGLRGIPAAKPITVALAWAWVTVMLPVPPERWGDAAIIFFGRAAFIFALALAYDLVDLAYDHWHGLPTLAGKLGFDKTFSLINSALAFAALCAFANFSLKIYDGRLATAMFVSLAFSAWWLRFLLEKTNWHDEQKMLIDALMPLQFLMIWAANEFSK